MHTTAVTIQSNKIVSNEVKDSWVLLEPSYGKNQMNFLAYPKELKFIWFLNNFCRADGDIFTNCEIYQAWRTKCVQCDKG